MAESICVVSRSLIIWAATGYCVVLLGSNALTDLCCGWIRSCRADGWKWGKWRKHMPGHFNGVLDSFYPVCLSFAVIFTEIEVKTLNDLVFWIFESESVWFLLSCFSVQLFLNFLPCSFVMISIWKFVWTSNDFTRSSAVLMISSQIWCTFVAFLVSYCAFLFSELDADH